jgi:hypothetical protein
MSASAQRSTWNLVAAKQGANTVIHATGELFSCILIAKSIKAHAFRRDASRGA